MLFCASQTLNTFFPRRKEILLQRGADVGRGQQALAPGRDSSHTPVAGVGSTGKDLPVGRAGTDTDSLGWKWEHEG